MSCWILIPIWACTFFTSTSFAEEPVPSHTDIVNLSEALNSNDQTVINGEDELDEIADVIMEVLAEEEAYELPGLNPKSGPYYSNHPEDENPGDRRRFGDLTSILFSGRVMLESGYSYTTDDEDDLKISDHIYPDLLLRISLTEKVELQFGWPGIIRTNMDDDLLDESDTFIDTADPNIGLKYLLCEQESFRPRTLVLGSLPVKTDGNPFSQNNFQPFFNFIYGWNLDEKTIFSGSSGLSVINNSSSDTLDYIQLFTLDRTITNDLGGYAQIRSTFPDGNRSEEYMVFGGLYYFLANSVQLDGRIGYGLNQAAPDLVLGMGISIGF